MSRKSHQRPSRGCPPPPVASPLIATTLALSTLMADVVYFHKRGGVSVSPPLGTAEDLGDMTHTEPGSLSAGPIVQGIPLAPKLPEDVPPPFQPLPRFINNSGAAVMQHYAAQAESDALITMEVARKGLRTAEQFTLLSRAPAEA